MKRFIESTVIIAICSIVAYYVIKPMGDKTENVYHEYPDKAREMFRERGFYETKTVSGRPAALFVALGMFVILMSGNAVYEFYIVPKRKKKQENEDGGTAQ